jgi:MYXO-CTERM domain-containing protein
VATRTLETPLSSRAGAGHPGVERGARGVVVAASVLPMLSYLWVAAHQLGYPYELEWMEGGSVEIVNRVVHGQAIYVAPSLHYVPYAYPPLYFWVSAAVAHVTGVGFLPLRLVSFAASLGCLALLFTMVRRETSDAVAGVLAAGLFAATYEVGGAWLDIGRVDSLYLFLLLAAVAVARRATGVRGGLLVGGLVAASFLTKQSALLAAAPLLGLLVVTRRRVGLGAVATVVVLVVGTTLLFDATSHGWYGYYVLSELVHQGVDHRSAVRFPVKDLGPAVWALGLGVLGAAVGWRRRSATDWPFWVAVGAGFVLSSWVARAHSGGGRDVLIPAYAAVALLAGLGYDALRRAPGRPRALVGAALAVVVVIQVGHLADHPSHLVPGASSAAAGHHFVAELRATPGEVIVIDHPWYTTEAGKGSWAQGEAVHDVLRAGLEPARTDLLRSIEATLASKKVTTVYVDTVADTGPFATVLRRYFVADGSTVFSCYRCFFPVTDVATRPYLRYVRAPSDHGAS